MKAIDKLIRIIQLIQDFRLCHRYFSTNQDSLLSQCYTDCDDRYF